MLALTRQIGHDMHRIAWELGPAALEELDLPTALSNYAEEWSGHSRVPVQFRCTGPWEGRLPPQVETTLYRVVQEALTNVAKHAQADHVDVRVTEAYGVVDVQICDDGTGFDARATASGFGLLGIRERLAVVRGSVRIDTSPQAGTTVHARIPVLSARRGRRFTRAAEAPAPRARAPRAG
jgi:signal transduction histidine kinase